MNRYESGLTVRISGLLSEERAHALNEAVANLLTALTELPGFEGDLVVSGEVMRYDESDPDAEAVVIWPTTD